MDRIIRSLLDTDLYKLTMQQAVFHQYPRVQVEYQFIIRNGEKLGFLTKDVQEQVRALAVLELNDDEAAYLSSIRFLKPDYVDFLHSYRFDPSLVRVSNIGGQLAITVKGPWLDTILYEVPILAIVSELRSNRLVSVEGWKGVDPEVMQAKISQVNHYRLPLADMGTRRRFSFEHQRNVVKDFVANCPSFVGTSNVLLAKELKKKAIGTQAHEWFMAHMGLVDNLAEVQKRALHVWLQEYGTDLGYALTDTFTTKAFFHDFGVVLANGFSGLRQDSGDPIAFGYKAIEHYKSLGIDPRLKYLIFSDSLTIAKAVEIYLEFVGKIGVSFGIGTFLTNDVGIRPPNMVIKMTKAVGKPVIKISDSPGKVLGSQRTVEEFRKIYGF